MSSCFPFSRGKAGKMRSLLNERRRIEPGAKVTHGVDLRHRRRRRDLIKKTGSASLLTWTGGRRSRERANANPAEGYGAWHLHWQRVFNCIRSAYVRIPICPRRPMRSYVNAPRCVCGSTRERSVCESVGSDLCASVCVRDGGGGKVGFRRR